VADARPARRQVRLGKNILANATGRAWNVLSQFLLTPIYLSLLGLEGFGLVGVYMSATAVIQLADLGLGAALNRELARLSSRDDSWRDIRDITKTAETLYAGVALILVAAGLLASSRIAENWLSASTLSPETLTKSVRIMVVALSAQFLCAIYQGGLLGMQAHVALNSVNVTVGVFRAVLTLITLWTISATPQAFFFCQALANIAQVVLLRLNLLQRVRTEAKARFRIQTVLNTVRYAGSMFALSVTTVFLMQLDKLILTRLLPLATIGCYTLAWSLSQIPSNIFSAPIHQTFFPRFTQLLSIGATDQLRQVYHLACQVAAVVVIPVSLVLFAFPAEAVDLWLRNASRAQEVAPLLRVLAFGGGLAGLMLIPHCLLLAQGRVEFALRVNGVAIVLMGPLIVLLTLQLGAKGGCVAWLLLNLGYLAVYVPTIHRRILGGGNREWLLENLVKPGLAAGAVVLISVLWAHKAESRAWNAFLLGTVLILSSIAAATVCGAFRTLVFARLRTLNFFGARL
jgi:O-antigen/teichoic acid export membrane protein